MAGIEYLSQYGYDHYTTAKDSVTVYTKGMAAVRIWVCSSYIFRVWADKDGRFEKRPSFAVQKEEWGVQDYVIEETENCLCIKTEILSLEMSKSTLDITYRLREDGQLLLTGSRGRQMGFREDGSLSACYELGEEEHIYGLGEDNDAYQGNMDRRGSCRDLVTGQTINKGCVTADIPVPFFLSTGRNHRAYGFFVDNTYHMEFNMGKESANTFFWNAKGGEAVTYFIYGPAFTDIIDRYTNLTGKPEMLPLWTLGLIQCKCSYHDWEEVDDVIGTLGEKGFPVDCIVFDFDWPEHLHNFKWHPRWKGLSRQKIREYNEKGIHFMVSNTGPMIKKDSSNFQDALDHGVMALDAQGNTLTCGHYGGELMDFSAPNMKEWLKKQLIPLLEDGVEGWWLDLTEPEGEPVQTLYKGGTRQAIHNVYSYLSSKAYYDSHKECRPDARPFILTRTGTAGIQRLGNSIWSGDVYSDYKTFSAHCPEALNTGLSGIPYWTSDIGGFISSTYDSSNPLNVQLYQNDPAAHGLLYERWFQFGCFCPITRVHHAGPSEPYRFGELVEESCRRYISLRYQLLPYIYTYMRRTHENGLSIMRPLVLQYQEDENVYGIKDEFLFGESLLVAPVLEERVTEREVYFPEGAWIDWDYGYEYQGGRSYKVYAPQNRIPLYVKKGSILPMTTERKTVLEKPWDPIILQIYPEGTSSFTMYQDDGMTMEFEKKGIYTETVFTCEAVERGLTLSIQPGSDYFVPEYYELVIHADRAAERALYCGAELPVYTGIAAYKKAEEGLYVDGLTQLAHVKVRRCKGDMKIDVFYGKRKWEKTVPGKNMEPEEKQMPYFLPPATVPCKIQAENYDRGGEGIAYHIGHEENQGGEYRKEAVNIEVCDDAGGGYDVFGLVETEWLEYTVNITKNLTVRNRYNILLRISCDTPDSAVHVEVDNDNKSGTVSVPVTTADSPWITLTIPDKVIYDGEHVLKFCVEKGKVKLNYMEIEIA